MNKLDIRYEKSVWTRDIFTPPVGPPVEPEDDESR